MEVEALGGSVLRRVCVPPKKEETMKTQGTRPWGFKSLLNGGDASGGQDPCT